jgi:2,3,4,5-tetrahydropyridine-2,6-dicarboxylate N-succinyltransferase
MTINLQNIIEEAFENRNEISGESHPEVSKAVSATLALLDSGKLRICEKENGDWKINQWAKKAILLSFRINTNKVMSPSKDNIHNWYDKMPLKFANWDEEKFKEAGFRATPGAIVRHSAYIGKNVVLLPSFVNLGAYVGDGTMIDTWSTVGSCAQIGKNCHISGGVGIGGVLEPLQANPVIIEDNCFIGARSEIAEGVIIGEGAVISMGVYIGSSTKIIDRETGEIIYGKVPPYSVVVSGNIAGKEGQPSLYAAVIVKKVDEKTRSKTSINELLRH